MYPSLRLRPPHSFLLSALLLCPLSITAGPLRRAEGGPGEKRAGPAVCDAEKCGVGFGRRRTPRQGTGWLTYVALHPLAAVLLLIYRPHPHFAGYDMIGYDMIDGENSAIDGTVYLSYSLIVAD